MTKTRRGDTKTINTWRLNALNIGIIPFTAYSDARRKTAATEENRRFVLIYFYTVLEAWEG